MVYEKMRVADKVARGERGEGKEGEAEKKGVKRERGGGKSGKLSQLWKGTGKVWR